MLLCAVVTSWMQTIHAGLSCFNLTQTIPKYIYHICLTLTCLYQSEYELVLQIQSSLCIKKKNQINSYNVTCK